jgi:hypothetical protein
MARRDVEFGLSYADAGRALRQAHERAVAATEPDLATADWQVFSAVLAATVSLSKYADRLRAEDLAQSAGVSPRQARRSLGRLAAHGIVLWVPGRGRGRLTKVGVPEQGRKAADYLATFAPAAERPEDGKSGQIDTAKAARSDTEKRPPTRTRDRDRGVTEKTEEGNHWRSATADPEYEQAIAELLAAIGSDADDATETTLRQTFPDAPPRLLLEAARIAGRGTDTDGLPITNRAGYAVATLRQRLTCEGADAYRDTGELRGGRTRRKRGVRFADHCYACGAVTTHELDAGRDICTSCGAAT